MHKCPYTLGAGSITLPSKSWLKLQVSSPGSVVAIPKLWELQELI